MSTKLHNAKLIWFIIFKQVEDEYLIQLEGVADREAAAKFRDFQLFVKQEERPELEEEEFLISELVGCTVLYSEVRVFIYHGWQGLRIGK